MVRPNKFDRACVELGIGEGIKKEPIPIIPYGNRHYRIGGILPAELNADIKELCSYTIPGVEYTERMRRGHWDGCYHLMRSRRRIPRGLFPLVAPLFSQYDLTYEIQENPLREISRTVIKNTLPRKFDDTHIDAITTAVNARERFIPLPTDKDRLWVIMGITKMLYQSTLIVVRDKESMYRTANMLEKFFPMEFDRIGLYGDGTYIIGNNFTVAIARSIKSKYLGFFRDFRVVIFKECHLLGASMIYTIGRKLNATYVYGLSDTITPAEGHELKLQAIVGPIIQPPIKEVITHSTLAAHAEIELYSILTSNPKLAEGSFDYRFLYQHGIVLNKFRNSVIVQAVKSLLDREIYPIYISVNQVKHGTILEGLIREITPSIESVYALKCNRKQILEDYKGGNIKVLISTLLGEGEDLSLTRSVVIAGGGAGDLPIKPMIDKILESNSDSSRTIIIDFKDLTPPFDKHSINRVGLYKRMGFDITNVTPGQKKL